MSGGLRVLLLSLALTGSLSANTRAWARLKVGMTARETATLLGEPLLRSHGRGFETWTYDHGAEVLIYSGTAVVGWTSPSGANQTAHSEDIWANHPRGEYYATMHSILPRPSRPARAPVNPRHPDRPAPASAGTGYEAYLRG